LREAQASDRLRVCILDIDRFRLIWKRDEVELISYWIWLGQEKSMDQAYVSVFDSWSGPLVWKQHLVSSAASELAAFLNGVAQYAGAESLMRRVLKIDEERLGEEDVKVAQDLNNLALLLMVTNRSSEAEPLMRRALEIDEKRLGKITRKSAQS
jgi:nephrocystin-3